MIASGLAIELPLTERELPAFLLEFEPFSLSHAIALAWTLGMIIGACWLGRRLLANKREDAERRLCAAWGSVVLAVSLFSMGYWLMPGRFRIEVSLPLQLCDLAVLVAPWAFLTQWRWPRTLLYFWGIGLSTQAFVTPVLPREMGVLSVGYWLFWGLHLAIVGSAIYTVVVRRFRPTLRDLLFALGVTTTWFVAMFGFNELLGNGASYGYIGRDSRGIPTIEKLGPWPWRVLLIGAIGAGLFVVLWALGRDRGMRDLGFRK